MQTLNPAENHGVRKLGVRFYIAGTRSGDADAVRVRPSQGARPARPWCGGERWLRISAKAFTPTWAGALPLILTGLLFALPTRAQTVTFDFDTGTPALSTGQNVPFDQDTGGVTAHFSAAGTGFSIQDYTRTLLHLSGFSGNYLYPNGANGVLVIQFSQEITNLSLTFATAEQKPIENPTPVRLIAYTNSTATPSVGSTNVAGAYNANALPVGTLTFSSPTPFNLVTLNIQPGGATGFLVDNLTVKVSGGTHYTITTSASPAAGGITTGDGTYLSGAPVVVGATANAGYSFLNWTENGIEVSTLSDYAFTASAYRSLVANFVTPVNLTTAASPPEGGSTLGDGTYPSGSTVSVTASPNSAFAFVNWTINGVPFSTWASSLVTLNSNTTVVANFAPACVITAGSASTAAGCASGGGTYATGTSVEVLAVPRTGFAFANWTDNGVAVSAQPNYSFTASTNRALVANFVPDTAIVTFDFDTSTPALTNTQATPFDQTSGGLTAHFSSPTDPAAFSIQSDATIGWALSRFSGNYLAPNVALSALDIQFSQPVTSVSVGFATLDFQDFLTPSTMALTAYATSITEAPIGTATTQGTYILGDTMPMGLLAFNSVTQFQVVHVSLPFNPLGALGFVADNITAQVVGPPSYTITTEVLPAAGGTASGGGTFTNGASVTVTALANPGYGFVNWTEGGSVVGTQASYSFTVGANRTLVANFAPQLSIVSTTTNALVLSWTAASPGYTLQENPALGVGGGWTDSTNLIEVVGSQKQVTVVSPAGSRFYRLLHP